MKKRPPTNVCTFVGGRFRLLRQRQGTPNFEIVLVKGLIDADRRIPLELSCILKPRVIHGDRTVEILSTFYRENDIRPLWLIRGEELEGDIL